MSERKRLIEILNNIQIQSRTLADIFYKSVIEKIADRLLENGVIVPPCDKVYFIVNKGTQFEYVDSMSIHCLKIYEAKNLAKYGFYTTKEEAEKALKGGATNE